MGLTHGGVRAGPVCINEEGCVEVNYQVAGLGGGRTGRTVTVQTTVIGETTIECYKQTPSGLHCPPGQAVPVEEPGTPQTDTDTGTGNISGNEEICPEGVEIKNPAQYCYRNFREQVTVGETEFTEVRLVVYEGEDTEGEVLDTVTLTDIQACPPEA